MNIGVQKLYMPVIPCVFLNYYLNEYWGSETVITSFDYLFSGTTTSMNIGVQKLNFVVVNITIPELLPQ